ncbi:MAG: Tol-Pal system protein TolB, partial [Parvibaculales bacterium]
MNVKFFITLSRRLPAFLAALTLVPGMALAALKIDITQGNVEPLPIAVLDFAGEGTVGQDLAG